MPARRPLVLAGLVVGAVGVFAIAAPFLAGISLAYAIGALLVVGGLSTRHTQLLPEAGGGGSDRSRSRPSPSSRGFSSSRTRSWDSRR